MVVDHIGEFFPGQTPLALRWIGRLSAPIFVFCLCEGLRHTSDRKRFLCRLYFCAVGMAAGNLLLNSLFSQAPVPLHNHIFSALFLLGGWIVCMEHGRRGFTALFVWQCGAFAFFAAANALCPPLAPLAGDLLPGIFSIEGGPALLLLGLLFYYFGRSRRTLSAVFVLWSGLLFLSSWIDLGLWGAVREGYQWMGIGALPILLCYNGRRGRGGKLFFYLFYPLHVYFLFILSNLINN